jgi:oxygen-independent coproporphyrinogen-3 oxidase
MPEVRYIDSLIEDLAEDVARYAIRRPVSSIFIGGGTPSLFSPQAFERLLRGISQQVQLQDALEITLEANPGTFESHKFAAFRSLGINRLSIGVQSFDDAMLKKLGRVHSANEAIRAVNIAHQAGFDNINLDLMFGLPDASFEVSVHDIRTAISLKPTHISFYQLTLEPNTYFHRFPPKLPDDDSIFKVQKHCQALLADAGYAQYEVSAYSQLGRQCRHNLNYWQFGDYLGIGAGAHGKITLQSGQILRTCKPKKPEQYLRDRVLGTSSQAIMLADLPLEFLMNHLRLKQGFSLATYQQATSLGGESLEPGLSECLQQGLMVVDDGRYVCSEQGWLFLDSVLAKFLL